MLANNPKYRLANIQKYRGRLHLFLIVCRYAKIVGMTASSLNKMRATTFLIWVIGSLTFRSRLWAAESFIIWVAFILFSFGMNAASRSYIQKAFRLVPGTIAPFLFPILAGTLFTMWGIWQTYLLRDPGDFDFSCYTNAIWNLTHGSHWMSIAKRDIFGSHSSYTLWAWVPVWRLVEQSTGPIHSAWIAPLFLKGIQGLSLTLAGCIIISPLRNRVLTCNLLGLAVIISPSFAAKFFFGFHPEVIGAPILAWMILKFAESTAFARTGKPMPILHSNLNLFLLSAAALFLCATKETYSLAIAGILLCEFMNRLAPTRIQRLHGNYFWKIIGILKSDPYFWILPLLCTGYLAAYWFYFIPLVNNGSPMPLATEQPHSITEILNLWFRADTVMFILWALLPVVILFFKLPWRFLLLIFPWILFYASFPDCSYRELFRHYYFPFILLAYGGIAWHPGLFRKTYVAGGLLTASLLCFPLSKLVFVGPIPGTRQANEAIETKNNLLALFSLVPVEGRLLCHGHFQYLCASRQEAENYVYRYRPSRDFDYILFDTQWRQPWMPALTDLKQDFSDFILSDTSAARFKNMAGHSSVELWSRVHADSE